MEAGKPYKYYRNRSHPPHLAPACRKKDVDDALVAFGHPAPFHSLSIGGSSRYSGFPPELRKPAVPASFVVARASLLHHPEEWEFFDYQRNTFHLDVFVVPRVLAGEVRELLRSEGFSILLGWLRQLTLLPETAHTHHREIYLHYHVAADQMSTEEQTIPKTHLNR